MSTRASLDDDASVNGSPPKRAALTNNNDEDEEENELETEQQLDDDEPEQEMEMAASEPEEPEEQEEPRSSNKRSAASLVAPPAVEAEEYAPDSSDDDEQVQEGELEEQAFDEEEEQDDDDNNASVAPKPRIKKSRTTAAAASIPPALVARPHSRKTNTLAPAEAGIIKNIYLENFMCHRKLSVDFCPNVNFVNGDNGSGKSAILAAIQICLGASAKRTGRGRNMRELIRNFNKANPPACAKVRVSLSNGGSDGYKQDVYGNVVTVERTINSGSGFNGYKLLDAAGKEQSRSRHELYEMLDHL